MGIDDKPRKPADTKTVSRSDFLSAGFAALGAVGATAAALSPLAEIEEGPSFDKFFQKHYKELSKEDMAGILERTRKEVKEKYGVDAKVSDPQPMEGVEFAYALNIGRCVGCRKCVYACMKENNQSRDPQAAYIRVMKMEKGSIDVESSDLRYEDETVPSKDHYYMPVQCHQCKNAPCVKACPVGATWQEKDGIVAIDYDWCIGCRYCMAACPYGARVFNFSEPTLPSEEVNPDMSYLGNRPRPKGVVEKCHFCMQRTRKGKYPACVEVCPTGSRKFGNILDPESDVSQILKNKRVYIFKEEVGTLPRFYYYFDV